MPDFGLLGSMMNDLHQEFVRMYYLMLPVFFALAVVVAWFKNPTGSPEFVAIIKRAIIATILLAAFPDISKAILWIADGITERIDSINSLDTMIRMAQEKSESYTFSVTSVILQFNDLLIATLSFLSYLVLYIARYLTIAMYHFFWTFFMVAAPVLLLFNLFEGTQQITVNLFKGMIEVACWKIMWAILGAMLTAISFGDAYQAGNDGYIVLIVMNFVIACAMLMTPMMVSAIAGKGLQSMSSAIGAATVTAMASTPAKAVQLGNFSRHWMNRGMGFMKQMNGVNFAGSSGGSFRNRSSTSYSEATPINRGPTIRFTPPTQIGYQQKALPPSSNNQLPPPAPKLLPPPKR
ncbi:MAG: hypothetical protein AB7I27_11870 [Bacteriovoracaceae bacterium]